MKTKHKLWIFILALLALPSLALGVGYFRNNSSGIAPEQMRSELTKEIVKRWSPYVSETYGTSGTRWAQQMETTFKTADISNLERAVTAPTYDQMAVELFGGAIAPTKLTAVSSKAGSRVTPKALGTGGSDLVYTPVNPCRLVDSRLSGGMFTAGETRSFRAYTATTFAFQGGAASNCGIPANASALSVKIVSEDAASAGYFTAFPFDEQRNLASTLNYASGITLSNQALIRLCRPGCTAEFNVFSEKQSSLIIDVDGYFIEPVATALDCTVVQQSGNLALLSGIQMRSVNCPVGYTATGGGCGGPLGLAISNSEPNVVNGQPVGWKCDLVGSLLSILSYQVNATCCRVPGR